MSYHHKGDQAYYDAFSRIFHDQYELIRDNSLEREIDSENDAYVIQRIRDNYISGTSCTIVLVGASTWGRKYVDWEIKATLEKEHGLFGIQLPTLTSSGGTVSVPERLHDNISSGYALWLRWDFVVANPHLLSRHIEDANTRSKRLIDNSCARRLRNAS